MNILLVIGTLKQKKLINRYNKDLAESISMVIKDETAHFGSSKIAEDLPESIEEDSIDSFDEYIGSKFGTSIMKSGVGASKSNAEASKSKITEIIGNKFFIKFRLWKQ